MTVNAFTVDVEDYFQVSAFARQVHPTSWDGYESRVVANTERILDLLSEFRVRGTFFVLGWVADKFPELVKRIASDGHEIGCHSYWHRLVYDLSPQEFRDDLRQSRDAIQQAAGVAVTAYRAPSFSIVRRSLWALEILVQEGFVMDSSIFPVRHDRYGIPEARIVPYRAHTDSGTIWEYPPTVLPVFGYNLPVGGGGYLRLYPYSLTRSALKRVNAVGRPFQIYVHPWEVDPQQPKIAASMRSRFRHYVNLGTTTSKLRSLLQGFQFSTLSSVLHSDSNVARDNTPVKLSGTRQGLPDSTI
ncbi:MAG: DUF3473 domain-containing protein [Planctomycetota bacterium]|nr:DUF3473 domain-containing protein [Planctomycetota bacterium]